MFRIHGRLVAAAAMLGSLSVAPTRAAVVTLEVQERMIEAHLTVVHDGGPPIGWVSQSDEVDRAPDVGPFSKRAYFYYGSDTREPYIICAASAAQNSTILGTFVHADGSAYAHSGRDIFGNPGWGRGKSVFHIRFTIHEPCRARFFGNAYLHPDPAEVLLTGPEGIVWHAGLGGVQGPFDVPWQVLPPGQYTLHAEAVSQDEATAFDVNLALDSPIVGVEKVSWSDVKEGYR